MNVVSESDWQRILGFAQVYLPRCDFTWQPLDERSWKGMTKKFKAKAARGPDGFSKEDLCHMPEGFTTSLLAMLHQVEATERPWPKQMLLGTVLGLAKKPQAHEVSHYRPITLFSMLYRCWARLRTKQIIQQMAQYIPAEALGFLPQRETTDAWMLLQATIEIMLVLQQPYCGMSTDVRRAFNHIGKPQIFIVAERLGLPKALVCPWRKFLDLFVRRFDIRGCVGQELTSTSGFPEGDPLSIVAMLCVNWSFHLYMKAFCPRVTAISYMDSLSLAANEAVDVAQAFFVLKSICALFDLSTDDDKTYVWALTAAAAARGSLSLLRFPCLSDSSEVGGAMTFGSARRNRELKLRGAALNLNPSGKG